MYYEWEWMSDLAIIPAFELFLGGILVGFCLALLIIALGNRTGGKQAMKGIDISHYQKGLRIAQAKADGNEFAIIKLTEGTHIIDGAALDFYTQAYETGFPVGCYCFSHATTAEEARAEAAFLLKTLNGFPMPCGVFLDVEAPEMLALSGKGLKIVCDAFCEAVRKAGYIPGLYGSELNLWAKIDADALEEDVIVWVAHYGKQPDVCCDIWQSSESGSVAGYSGPVDTDVVRSKRFEALVNLGYPEKEEQQEEPASDACPIFPPDPSVLVLEMVMAYNGYWGKPDGYKTPEFFKALRQFTDDMEAC